MKVFSKTAELHSFLAEEKSKQISIGFVPTMGFLHQGHLNLVEQAKKQCDIVVVSIYVNPSQFNNAIDLRNYPKAINSDIKKLQEIGCDVVFTPNDTEVYPEGVQLLDFDFGGLDKPLEGEFRPGHFQGMVTVVNWFFRVIQPNSAFFGEKDFQQLLIVKRLAKLHYPDLRIIPVEITREESGLAMSSRNSRLSSLALDQAKHIYQTLEYMANSPEEDAVKLEKLGREFLSKVPAIELEYLRVVNEDNLLPPTNEIEQKKRVFVAAFLEGVRLIDNMEL